MWWWWYIYIYTYIYKYIYIYIVVDDTYTSLTSSTDPSTSMATTRASSVLLTASTTRMQATWICTSDPRPGGREMARGAGPVRVGRRSAGRRSGGSQPGRAWGGGEVGRGRWDWCDGER